MPYRAAVARRPTHRAIEQLGHGHNRRAMGGHAAERLARLAMACGLGSGWRLRRRVRGRLRPHPSSSARIGDMRQGLVPPGWWATLHGRGMLLTVSGASAVHGPCAQPLESDVQSTNAGGSGHHPVEDTCHSIPLRAPGSSSPSTGGASREGLRKPRLAARQAAESWGVARPARAIW